ncbi:peptidylprolyl isomerase [Alteromonas sp. S015]|uniref:peptidylprolyl isomerase n=1 Tax=Alteromonas sp. S015 TaxID=3117401 RepID=UPI002FE13825
MNFRIKKLITILSCTALFSFCAQATIVEFATSQGNIRVNLHDTTTPKTVENFLNYVNEGAYTDTIIHRLEPDFVVQGGGFKYENGFSHVAVESGPAVENEPELSNVRGTIAMAKVSGNPDSATNQWFFNINDNSANLDVRNGGFTVFGQVFSEDMDILEDMQALPRCLNNVGRTPMVNFTSEQCTSGDKPGYENFVTVYAINVLDSNEVTDGGLNKTPNTLIDQQPGSDNDSGGGGTAFWLLLLGAAGLLRKR